MPATWKLRNGGKKGDGLYDLASNPEEDEGEDDDLEANGRINCFDDGDARIAQTQAVLEDWRCEWKTCIDPNLDH